MAPKRSSWRNVSTKDKCILWGRAAARCSHPDCKMRLIEPATDEDAEATFGQAGHIVSHSNKGPRGDKDFPREKLDSYENLILLCGNHHPIVDKQFNTYTREDLKGWKEEHESWVLSSTEPDAYKPIAWSVIVQEDQSRIDVDEAVSTLAPDTARNTPHLIRIDPKGSGWRGAAAHQEGILLEAIAKLEPSERRFAVFSLAPIPLAFHLGYVLSDRARVAMHQFDRDANTWKWPKDIVEVEPITISHRRIRNGEGAVSIRCSLSATVHEAQVRAILPEPIEEFNLTIESPAVTWLRSPAQLRHLGETFRQVLSRLREGDARVSDIHLFYAGPTGGAIAMGRQFNPRMNAPIHLYEFDRQRDPPYEHALRLPGSLRVEDEG